MSQETKPKLFCDYYDKHAVTLFFLPRGAMLAWYML